MNIGTAIQVLMTLRHMILRMSHMTFKVMMMLHFLLKTIVMQTFQISKEMKMEVLWSILNLMKN